MYTHHRLFFIGTLCASLAACGSSSYSSVNGSAQIAATGTGASGSTKPPSTTFNQAAVNKGTHDTVVGMVTSATVGDKVSVIVGVQGSAAITFTSDDGRPITGFSITDTKLPADWTLPPVVGCAQVSTGSSCVLNFGYAPKAYLATGTVTLHYLYVDNAAEPVTFEHTMTFDYQATTQNNVLATVQPVGQITATALAVQTVTVTFNTDDTYPAYAVTPDLSTLPAGWSVASSQAPCATVSTGNGCELVLQYAPTDIDQGTLTLNYTYQDDSLETKGAKITIPYTATIDNNVAATANPTSVATIVGNPNGHATLYFTTDKGPVTQVAISSDLTALPQYWSAATNSFTCAELDPTTAAACTFGLTFAPMAPSSGTVSLTYSYVNDAGFNKTGTVMIPYQSTTDNNVNGVASANPIAATVGVATPVSFTFSTDDGNPAGNFTITSGLPTSADWTGPTTFACANFQSACVLTLTYTPTAITASTPLTLGYSYINDSGTLKFGTVSVTYSAL